MTSLRERELGNFWLAAALTMLMVAFPLEALARAAICLC